MHIAITILNLILALGVVGLATLTATRLRGSTMFWAAAVLVFTGLTYAAHAVVVTAGLGGGIAGVSSYVAAILFFFLVVVLDISTRLLGVR
jgi:uncharacterized membrane protein YtjA (UPF0391 family)